jgi:pimeloyl-ACP methyl ester carboxylesterase
MKTAHVNDIDIQYELTGEGEPVLLIHGSNIATG